MEYIKEVNIPKYNNKREYQFMDVFENLALFLIVKKEVNSFLVKYREKVKKLEKTGKIGITSPLFMTEKRNSNKPRMSTPVLGSMPFGRSPVTIKTTPLTVVKDIYHKEIVSKEQALKTKTPMKSALSGVFTSDGVCSILSKIFLN